MSNYTLQTLHVKLHNKNSICQTTQYKHYTLNYIIKIVYVKLRNTNTTVKLHNTNNTHRTP